MGTWAEQSIDQQVDKAWLALRMDLADRFEVGLSNGHMVPIDITAPTGQTVSVNLVDDHLVVMAGDDFTSTQNVDKAAYQVCSVLHERWQVVHPVFLDSEVVEVPSIDDSPIGTLVPTLGHADSAETLQTWVEATFQESLDEPLKVHSNGDISWKARGGLGPVVVSVRDQHWIEVWTVLASQVSFAKARRTIEKLSRRWTGCSFTLRQDRIVMSRLVDASPFVPQHLEDALRMHLDLATQLRGVQGKVLRKRVREQQEAQRRRMLPPEVLALVPSANRVSTSVLAAELRRAVASHEQLRAWMVTCRVRWLQARRVAEGKDDPHRIHHRQVAGWLRLVRALELALKQAETEEAA